MALIIYNNIPSLTGQRYVGITNNNLSKSLEKLSSGLRINHASDDASGLAISEKLRGQISGLKRAAMNAQDGISMLQTAEGAMGEIQSITQRMRELAVQAANGVYTTNDRKYIQDEMDQLKAEINRISSSTEFNTKKLLNGDATALWSTDQADKLSAIVKSQVAEGNYNINAEVQQVGKNYVYKSDVMTLNEGAIGAEFTNGEGTAATDIIKASNPVSLWSTGEDDYTINVATATESTTATTTTVEYGVNSLGAYLQDGSAGVIASSAIDTASVPTDFDGYALVEITSDTGSATVYFYSATTGELVGNPVDDNDIFDNNGIIQDVATGTFQAGDKFLFSVSRNITYTTGSAPDGSGSIAISGGPAAQQQNITINFTAANSLASADSDVTQTIYLADLDESTGNLNLGSIDLTFAKNATGETNPGSGTLRIAGGGEAATSTTKLKDLARFTTADGRNLFDNTQELTIFGNGKTATIYLEGDDTISDFEQKLTSAIVDQLGMGTNDATVNNNLVNYVAPGSATANTNEALAGTFVIQSALLGQDSQLAFIGDQALIDGLSLATIQKGEESAVKVTVTDAHTGKAIGSDVVNDSTLRGVIQGVDVKLASNIGTDVSWDNDNKALTFAAGDAVDLKLHLVDNATELQIGANEGQSITTTIGQMDTKSLGLDDVYVVSQELAQKSITKIDRALESISGARATIGAQVNRLNYAINNLNVTRENLTAAESRIRDLDIAEEMATFTRNQILSQAGTAMLAQANQLPQMALQLLQ
jgi:flagellin